MIKNRLKDAVNKNQLRRYSSAVVTRSTNKAMKTKLMITQARALVASSRKFSVEQNY
jgi:hypothetical protein